MESKAQSIDKNEEISNKLKLVAQGESIIQERIQKEVDKVKTELSSSSAIIAAVLGILCTNVLTNIQQLPLTGDYKYLWATLIGLIVGPALGERLMLVAFGILLGLKLATF